MCVPSHAEEEQTLQKVRREEGEGDGVEKGRGGVWPLIKDSFGCCACARRHAIVLNAIGSEITYTWILV